MISINRGSGRLLLMVFASGMVVWASRLSVGIAGDVVPASPAPSTKAVKSSKHHPTTTGSGAGTLGYGPPGLHPGFQGFGLGYHLGYGYGGAGLGVGTFGGYPYYGGPGYPHPWPTLNRLGPITPFCFYGGPGGPSPDQTNFFGAVGPLSPDQPVVFFERDPSDPPYNDEYGGFTGSLPYPESAFAPLVTMTTSGGSYRDPSNSSPSSTPSTIPPSNRWFGVDGVSVPVVGAGVLGLKIVEILPGSVAEKAGLRVGDVLLAINGHFTQLTADLSWILEKAATEKVLKIKVRSATDSKPRDLTVPLP